MLDHMVIAASSKGARRLSAIAALAAGEAYSIYATFFGHALRPPSVYVADQYTRRHLLSGQVGYIEEVFYWDDLIQLLAVSLLIFALVWWGAWMAVRFAYEPRSTTVTSPREIASHPASQRIADPIVRSVPVQDGLLPVPRPDLESRSYSTAAEHQALGDSSQPQRILKLPIVLEAAWELTDPSPEITVIADADYHRIHTANIAASSLKIRHSKVLRRYHDSEQIQRAL